MSLTDYIKRRASDLGSTISGDISSALSPTGPRTGVAADTTAAPVAPVAPVTPTDSTLYDPSKYVAGKETADPTKTYTALGKAYQDRLGQTLSGNDPVVANAQANAKSADAVGAYLARRQAGQESANAGYSPGTLQAQRTTDRYQSSADAASLARDNSVNQLQRDQAQTALQGAAGVEANAASRASQLEQENQAYTENLIKSVTDPVAQAYLRRVQAAGGDISQAYQTIYGGAPAGGSGTTGGTSGTGSGAGQLADGYRSDTPAEAAQKSAEDWVKTTHPELVPGSNEYNAAVQARAGGADDVATQGILDQQAKAKKDAAISAATTKGLGALSEQEKADLLAALPASTSLSAVPQGKTAIEAAMADTNGGDLYKVGNDLYKVDGYYQQTTNRATGFGSARHRDWTVVTDGAGNKLWISQNSADAAPIILTSAPKNYQAYIGDQREAQT